MPPRLNIIGAGRVGRTLGRLWSDAKVFQIQDVLARHETNANDAVGWIGTGRAIARLSQMSAGEAFLVATGDDQIAGVDADLARSGLAKGAIVFHCSGAHGADLLAQSRSAGALVASLHPLASFADPQDMIGRFAGTVCAIDGDDGAFSLLDFAARAIGGHPLRIDSHAKIIYHAAAVMASNYLVSLLHCALQTFKLAGIASEQAMPMMQPLAQETLRNVFRLGTEAALTGPIARGDNEIVRAQYLALASRNTSIASLYRALACATADLAHRPDPLADVLHDKDVPPK